MLAQVLAGLLRVVVVSVAPVAVCVAFLRAGRGFAWMRRLARRLHLTPRPIAEPDGPPLEQLAADLRRLYPRVHHPAPGTRMPKQRGVVMAYDHRLLETARALGVATTLPDLPPEGFDREAERLRVEHALTEAGLVWQVRLTNPGVDPAA